MQVGEVALRKGELEALQWQKLSRLMTRAYDTSPFYRRWLDAAGAQPDKVRSLADFRRAVPLMRKEDVLRDQMANPPYGDRLSVPRERIIQVTSTGGTSGKGKEIYALTAGDLSVVSRAYAVGCYGAGIRAGDVVAMTFPMSMSGAPLWIYEAFRRMHTNLLCIGPYDTRTRLSLMRDFGARVLVATPSYIEQMAATAQSELGWNVAADLSVDIILTATEAFSLERIRRIEETWGAKVYEWYGASQRIIAWNCRHGAIHTDGRRGLLHHLPHIMMLETLHPVTHEPVEYGEEGEVVATFLDAEASPLLRFATGDRVRLMPASSCGCGCHYDGYESGTITRYDDMVKVRGVNIWPTTTDEVFFRNTLVANYIGLVRSRPDGGEEVVVEVEFKPEADQAVRETLLSSARDDLRSILGLKIDVTEARKSLPSFTDTHSKARRWRDERHR